MRRVSLASLVLLACASATRADEPKVEVKETYWQRLADVSTVTLDSNRDPVFHLKDGYYFPKTGKFVAYREGGPWAPAHFDRAGRVWVLDSRQSKVHFWNDGKWETLDHHPVRLFDDSTGRVFLFDGKNVRVLGKDGKWSVQAISEKPHLEDVGFVEQGKRVWLWGSREKPGSADGITGVWSYADGKWTHHDTKGGLPFDSVKWIHALADGRFVLLEDRPPSGGGKQPAFWHPDRKLKDDEKLVFRDKYLTTQGGDPATGIDGTLYLGAAQGFKGGLASINPKGEVGFLTNRNEMLDRMPQASFRRQRIVFAKLGDPLPVLPHSEGDFVGADRDGRYYYRTGGRKGVTDTALTVVWPKHEEPGDILRLEKLKVDVAQVVKDDAGKIWGESPAGTALLQWHAGKWLDTPVQPLYHPTWMARPAAPWQPWSWAAQHIFRLHGKNGSILLVRVRDSYHIEDVPEPGAKPAAIPRKLPGGQNPYWPEAWLFRDGKWTGPLDLATLFAKHSAALLADFPTAAGTLAAFAFANDGTRLWAAFDGKVFTADKAGKVIEADWPREKPKTLPLAMLSKLPDGKVLLTSTLGDGHTLSLNAEGKIAATDFAMPAGHPAANPNERLAHWKLAKDGTLWYWTADRYHFGGHVWHYRDSNWAEKKGVGAPLHEDADGNLWCHPEPRSAGKVQILVVNGTETKELTFAAEDWQFGFTTVPKGAAAWAMGDRLYCLDPNGPGGKPVLRWRLLSESVYGLVPAVIDSKGNVLLGELSR